MGGHFDGVTHVIDAGAHEGAFGRACSLILPTAEIHCFEPAPGSFSRLKSNTASWPNIRPINAALGSSEGTMSLHIGDFDQANSLLSMTAHHTAAWASSQPKGTVEVGVTTVDQYCGKEIADGLFFLKADVQGFELELLKGASKTLERTKIIQLEVSFVPLYQGAPSFPEVWEFVAAAGFQLLEIGGTISSPNSGLPMQADFMFIRV